MRARAVIASASEAVKKIPSASTVAIGGFVGAGHPEMLTKALEKHFHESGTPRDLTLFYCAGQGDRNDRGLNHLAHEGLIKRVIGGHWNLAPRLGTLALSGTIEAYNFPQGVLSCLLREIAAGRPGLITRVGLNTFIDPDFGGGRLNDKTTEPLVEKVEWDGQHFLRYKPVPINVSLIRATRSDAKGNLTMEREGLIGEVLPMAQAAHNAGGIVIAQVEEISEAPTDPKSVRVPGILIDYLVVSQGVDHDQTFGEVFNPEYVGPSVLSADPGPLPAPERLFIGARALAEIREGDIVNLGIGLPETVAFVARATGRLDKFTLTVESGPTGGLPSSGLSFGCSRNPEAIIDQPAQFDFYDGGGLDIAILGAVEVDAEGSVNVASLGDRFAGVGGFVNIARSAKRLVFCCTLLAKGRPKFVRKIHHVCHHGPSAIQNGQEILYVTERAVFALRRGGIEVIELVSGNDLERDVLANMEFRPSLLPNLKIIYP